MIQHDSLKTRLLAKLATLSRFVGEAEHRTAVYKVVHEDSSTASTPKAASEVAFCKKSTLKAYSKYSILTVALLLLAACANAPPQPRHVENICSIFTQYPDWYTATHECQQRWGVPIAIQMAIINQESSFDGNAKPPRRKLFWLIPWKHISSASGYSQALNGTWEEYRNQSGNSYGKRHHFDDANDFIGWYCHQAHQKLGIRLDDAYGLYLAYHEGIAGYQKRTYLKKPWLIRTAKKVAARAKAYQRQLSHCENQFCS